MRSVRALASLLHLFSDERRGETSAACLAVPETGDHQRMVPRFGRSRNDRGGSPVMHRTRPSLAWLLGALRVGVVLVILSPTRGHTTAVGLCASDAPGRCLTSVTLSG